MSKETSSREATKCICGNTFTFMEQHWPHCPMNPANMSAKTHGAGEALLKSLQAKFTKAELAHIAQHGGQMQDQPIGNRRSRARKAKVKR